MDLLWPEADPAAAVNNLNQTVFHLRREIDPTYRDGESPPYILSTADVVQVNPELVTTDLDEFRRLSRLIREPSVDAESTAAKVVDLVRGEFLSELRYEDWVVRMQAAVHAEVRASLYAVATREIAAGSDLAIRAATVLLTLDPFDEAACVVMADQQANSGRRKAARDTILGFAARLRTEFDEPPSPELSAALARLARTPLVQ